MKIVSIKQIIELNHLLKEKELEFIVHIRDACGGQSFYIEPLNHEVNQERYEEMYHTIESYFKENKMQVVYADNKYDFTIQ